jgi:hypothetical protein
MAVATAKSEIGCGSCSECESSIQMDEYLEGIFVRSFVELLANLIEICIVTYPT